MLSSIATVILNKFSNKISGVVHFGTREKKRGSVLISYITEPFTIFPWNNFSPFHTNYWECMEIAKLFSERGYESDIIDLNNETFIPRKKYSFCIDVQHNLERLSSKLPKDCVKILHIVSTYAQIQNEAEEKRIQYLYERHGVYVQSRRLEKISRSPEVANYLEGFGNKKVRESYAKFNKPIYKIPISTVKTFDFPHQKDFSMARKNFLWMGGGGMVHKGLDILLDVFASRPHLNLYVRGPVDGESDFVKIFERELRSAKNINVYKRIDVTSKDFVELTSKCASIIYPSCSEGTSGAVVQAIHAGLIPIMTAETGLETECGGITITDTSVEKIGSIVDTVAESDPESLREMAYHSWDFVRTYYTRENFSKTYAKFIDSIIHLHQ